jgi:hypothetical protein
VASCLLPLASCPCCLQPFALASRSSTNFLGPGGAGAGVQSQHVFFPKPPQTPLFRCKLEAPPGIIHNCLFALWPLAFCLLPLLPSTPCCLPPFDLVARRISTAQLPHNTPWAKPQKFALAHGAKSQVPPKATGAPPPPFQVARRISTKHLPHIRLSPPGGNTGGSSQLLCFVAKQWPKPSSSGERGDVFAPVPLACCLCLCLVKEETFFSTPDLSHERKSKKNLRR